jgi:hypothetical protein
MYNSSSTASQLTISSINSQKIKINKPLLLFYSHSTPVPLPCQPTWRYQSQKLNNNLKKKRKKRKEKKE